MRTGWRSFGRNECGAVAPTVALSLFGLIAAGGIAFDYARLANMDSELQNAADQAALAAATQLDGTSGACSRAGAAAAGLVANITRFANDSGGTPVVVATETGCDAIGKVRFYQDKTKATAATTDANANYVEVTVNSRTAKYALTPIVGVLNSGVIDATAFAGLGTAVCKVPPVMICNPQETATNTDFDPSALARKGLKVVSVGANGSWAPGNFGYLNSGGGSSGATGIREALGWGTPPGDCTGDAGIDTKPGSSTSVTDALNTRFDIYDTSSTCPAGGLCPASVNSVKDLVRPADASGNNACKLQRQGWQLLDVAERYWPTSATTPLAASITPRAMGHPRDMCHASDPGAAGYCTGPIGNGAWDRDAYFRTNYGWDNATWQTKTGLGASPSRYEVYAWEIANRNNPIAGGSGTVLGPRTASGSGAGALTAYGGSVCSASEGQGAAVVPDEATVDRRRFSVAVVNCLEQGVNGNSTNVPVKDWIDVFLVEPSIARGNRSAAGDVYIEVIGRTASAGGASSPQLVKRDVPYLIE